MFPYSHAPTYPHPYITTFPHSRTLISPDSEVQHSHIPTSQHLHVHTLFRPHISTSPYPQSSHSRTPTSHIPTPSRRCTRAGATTRSEDPCSCCAPSSGGDWLTYDGSIKRQDATEPNTWSIYSACNLINLYYR